MNTLRIVVLLILIDIAIPQVTLYVYCGIQIISWAWSHYHKQLQSDLKSRGTDNEDLHKISSESHPLLHP